MPTAGLAVPGALPPAEIAARSREALDRPLAHDVELTIAHATGEAVLLGAFQRVGARDGKDVKYTFHRRGSGGAAFFVGPGTLWVSLALATLDALGPCPPDKILNRHVRPLLRALRRCGALAHYFGRDWVSVAHRPAAAIGFAHDRASGRTHVEAFVAVSTPFVRTEDAGRASFLGKAPGTLEELTGKPLAMDRLSSAVAEAFVPDAIPFTLAQLVDAGTDPRDDARADPAWTVTAEEAIGEIGVAIDASGRLTVGGDLMVSRDALTDLHGRLASGEDADHALDASLAAQGVALEGVRSLRSFAELIVRARASSPSS